MCDVREDLSTRDVRRKQIALDPRDEPAEGACGEGVACRRRLKRRDVLEKCGDETRTDRLANGPNCKACLAEGEHALVAHVIELKDATEEGAVVGVGEEDLERRRERRIILHQLAKHGGPPGKDFRRLESEGDRLEAVRQRAGNESEGVRAFDVAVDADRAHRAEVKELVPPPPQDGTLIRELHETLLGLVLGRVLRLLPLDEVLDTLLPRELGHLARDRRPTRPRRLFLGAVQSEHHAHVRACRQEGKLCLG